MYIFGLLLSLGICAGAAALPSIVIVGECYKFCLFMSGVNVRELVCACGVLWLVFAPAFWNVFWQLPDSCIVMEFPLWSVGLLLYNLLFQKMNRLVTQCITTLFHAIPSLSYIISVTQISSNTMQNG